MGIQNMHEYVTNHYPENLIKFNSILYEEPKTSKKKWNLNIFS